MRFARWLKRLTLTEQSAILVFSYIVAFVVLIFGYSSSNIDTYINDQVMNQMNTYQVMVINDYHHNDSESELNSLMPKNMGHFIYKDGMLMKIYGSASFTPEIIEYGVENLEIELEQRLIFTHQEYETKYFYSINRFEENCTILTISDGSIYQSQILTLITGIGSVMVLVLATLFLILFFWVSSIIYPLGVIKKFIENIKNGIDGELNLNRGDEIGMLANAVSDMNKEIKHQERIKVEMLHNVSHDFKTPIATIKSYAESIKDGIYPYDTLEKSVDVIYDNAERLEKKVQGLLLLNRFGYLLDEGTEVTPVAMNEVIGKVLLANRVIRPELKIIVDLKDVIFYGKFESWLVAVENIYDNALRYATSKIEISLTKENGLIIKNDGEGLDPLHLEDIFKPYEKGKNGQFGLGLSIVRRICNIYNYRVTAYNEKEMAVFQIVSREKNNHTSKKTKKETK